jgi:hypothetical protein
MDFALILYASYSIFEYEYCGYFLVLLVRERERRRLLRLF